MKVEISAIGVCSPFGEAWPGFQVGVLNKKNCLVDHQPLQNLPFSQAGLTEKKSFRRYLQQRKAAKLFTPSAKLGLLACGRALDKHPMVNSQQAGLFVAVGREPPDEGEAERTLVVSHQDGELNTEKLSTVGRDLYPPLLPLKTLPNMILAHISIHLKLYGENGVWAGGPSAGIQAFYSAYWAVLEGRCPIALAGGADSFVDLGNARDLHRMGIACQPGEAGIFFVLQPSGIAENPIAELEWDGLSGSSGTLRQKIGYCGAVDELLYLAAQLATCYSFSWGGFHFHSKVVSS